jgi:regulator-associated protein of mTOR
MLKDSVPEVRTAALYALGTLIGDDVDLNEAIGLSVLEAFKDASPIVRKELAGTLGKFVIANRDRIVPEAVGLIEERHGIIMAKRQGIPPPDIVMARNICTSVWTVLLMLSVDSSPSVSDDAIMIVDEVNALAIAAASTDVLSSYFIRRPNRDGIKEGALSKQSSAGSLNATAGSASRISARNSNLLMPPSTPSQSTPKVLRKSASFASSLRSLAGFGPAMNTARSRNSTGGYGSSVPVEVTPLSGASSSVKRRDSDIPVDVAAGGATFFDLCCEYFTESQMRVCMEI